MYRASLIIDDDVLKAKREAIRKAPGEMGLYARRVLQPRLKTETKRVLGVVPGPVKRPFDFGDGEAGDRARRAYFAKRKGRLPYRRTGDTARAWDVKIDLRRNEGLISIFNLKKHTVWVYGPGFLNTRRRQVPGHKKTGWGKNFDQKIIYLSQFAQNLLIDGWYQVISRRRR